MYILFWLQLNKGTTMVTTLQQSDQVYNNGPSSPPDLIYSAVQGLKQPEDENHLQAELQSLLNQLVDKIDARGGLLSYNHSGTHISLAAGKTSREFAITRSERRLLFAGKPLIDKETLIYPISGSDSLVGILCIHISDQARLELCSDLVHAYARLAAQNIELTRRQTTLSTYADSLSAKKQDLEQIQKYNQNLLSITAHDLSSPLNAVSGYLEMIDEYLENNDHANKISYYYKRIQSGVSDISDMLTQLNEVIKLKKGFSSLDNTKFDVNELVRDVCHLLNTHAEKKDSSLQIDTKPASVYLNGDKVKFKRVIYNLVSNAIKYSREGRPIHVRTDTKEGQAYIYIKDRGPGISEEEMKTIFNPFVKHAPAENDTTSYGLGLYISSYFTKLMNGKIVANSRPGKGSTFTVVVPLAAAPSVEAKSA